MTLHSFVAADALPAHAKFTNLPNRRTGQTKPDRPRVVILGAGFGGLSAARAFSRCGADITIVDRRNYHLFQPLLYQVATAGLSPARSAACCAVKPMRGQSWGRFRTSTRARRPSFWTICGFPMTTSSSSQARAMPYSDESWETFAPGLKKIEDATTIRAKILMAFKRAEIATDAKLRQRLLTFIVVGGGPTGVEMAGAMAELAKRALKRDFRNIGPGAARIILLQRDPRVLPGFAEGLSRAAAKALEKLGVEVLTQIEVESVDANGVSAAGQRFDAHTVIWAAGVMASSAGRWLDAPRDAYGRIEVEPDLSVPGHGNIFAIGDTASVRSADGRPLPGIAPVAKREHKYVARRVHARITRGKDPAPFRYRHVSRMATVGRSSAVVDLGFLRLTGCPGWLMWSAAHVYFLIGFRNKFAVALNWLWAYLTYESGMRLITEPKK